MGQGSGNAGLERLGIIGYRPTDDFGRGAERELECLLEVGDVVRREGTTTGLISGSWSCGEVCEEAGSDGSGAGSACEARLCGIYEV